jgi:hypothetical protein
MTKAQATFENTLSFIAKYWVVFGFAAQIIFNYSAYLAFKEETGKSIESIVERVEKIEDKSVKDALVIAEINARLSSIETSLLFIKDALR